MTGGQREGGGDHGEDAEELEPSVAVPDDQPDEGENDHAGPEVTEPREERALVPAEPEGQIAHLTEAAGSPEAPEGRAVLRERRPVGPDRAVEMGRPPEEEPHRVGEHDGRAPDGDDQTADGRGKAGPQLGRPADGGDRHQQRDTEEREQPGDDEDLGADEELHHDEGAEHGTDANGRPPLPHEQIPSRAIAMSGGKARKAMLSWLRASSVTMKGENPYSAPPTKAAGHQRTHRRSRPKAANADRAGASVSATFMPATGPNSAVTGPSTTPRPSTLVSSSRLMPVGWKSHCE